MSKKPETLFKERVFKDLDTLPNCWYEKIQQVTIRGTPDILLCIKGKFIAIELKTEDGKLDALQSYKLTKIQKAGGWSYTVTPAEWGEVFADLKAI